MFFPSAHVDRLIVSASVALGAMVSTASGQTSGFTPLIASHSGSCLDVSGESLDDGASIIQWPCHGGDNQQWRLEGVADGYSRIVSRHSGKCLDVSGGSADDGASIIQWQCHGGDNQQWRLEVVADVGGATYSRIVSRHSGKCLDVSGGSADDGASIVQWQCHGGQNQNWLLLAPPAPPAPPTSPYPLLWVMVIDASGGCIEGATIQIVRAGDASDPIPQSTPCSVWDVDGGLLLTDLPRDEELTLRGAAPGYAPREMRFLPVSGGSFGAVFIELSR